MMQVFHSNFPTANKEGTRIPQALLDLLVLQQPDWSSASWREKFRLFSSLAESTKKDYQSATTAYLAFCSRLNLPTLPASENNLLLFIAELSQTKAYNTIHTYLAGVRHLHVLAGYPNPLEKAPQLQLALRVFRGESHRNRISACQSLHIYSARSSQSCSYPLMITTM